MLAAFKPSWSDKLPAGYEEFKIRQTDYDWSLNEQGK